MKENIDSGSIPFLTVQLNLDGVDISKSSKSSLHPLMIAFHENPQKKRQDSLMVAFFFLGNANVSLDNRMLKIPIQELHTILNKIGRMKDEATGEIFYLKL
jgi:hypothetical protein